MDSADVVVVGAGIGGLTAAVELGAAGLSVRVIEAGPRVGGKAGTVLIDGVEVDTGPSMLTLPWVFDDVLSRAGRRLDEVVELVRPEPAFHYLFSDGTELSLPRDLEASADAVRRALGGEAELDFRGYLEHARTVWEAAAPHFVFAPAPRLTRLARLGPRAWVRFGRIDVLSTLEQGIVRRVREPHLRDLFRRFATYSGSDVRRAPGTLACVAHVELGLGGFGVRGGMHALARALEDAARAVGVEFELGQPVQEIVAHGGRVRSVRRNDGSEVRTSHVVLNADPEGLTRGLFGPTVRRARVGSARADVSMSAYTGIVRAKRRARVAHSVSFPSSYTQEFVDIFDAGRVPSEPTIYVCALEVAHGRHGWREDEPLFVMVNAPTVGARSHHEPSEIVRDRVRGVLIERGAIEPTDDFAWWRTPEDLAREFPGSQGAIYGSAFHGARAAFSRPDNEPGGVQGLYLASGSAHPGGGVPLVAQSGKQAAQAVLKRWRLSA